ncbi:MAG TPA: polysaccharide deacetylase family protein, partial [Rubricoccaceae bacterium]
LRALVAGLAAGHPRRGLARALGPDARRASLDALVALARRHRTRSTLFVKTVGPGSPEDVPYRVDGALRTHLCGLAADGFEVGLHPGYATHDHAGRLAAERARLAQAVGAAPTAVRSHFLRWTEPTTPRLYARAGFRLDGTLGFAEDVGFRRGTAHPFRLWDAAAGAATDLWEMPLAAMDTTLFTHLGLDDTDAAGRLDAVLAEARRAGGVAVVLWHPAMDGDSAWARRLGVLDRAIGRAVNEGSALGPLGSLLDSWIG